jgi:hypothetical protein
MARSVVAHAAVVLCAFAAALQAGAAGPPAASPAATAPPAAPAYTTDGRLQYPADYRDWVFLSAGIDMSYSDAMRGHSMFDNVFVNREAYSEFLRTGTWPDRTILVLEVRGASEQGSINRHGKFQTKELMGLEAHVRDTARFAGGWGFFVFRGPEPTTLLPASAECYTCHREHGVVATTFVQFYPTLLEIATRKGTLTPESH